jgi:hypothetical protein
MTLYFIHLQQLELSSLVLMTFTDLSQHIPVFVEVRQQLWTLADRITCMFCAARYSLGGAKKELRTKILEKNEV